MFFIYTIQNKVNGKIYIGKTSRPMQRFTEHKSIANGAKPREFSVLHAAIQKYGENNFTFQIIEEWEKEQDAYDAEEFWIEFFRTDISRFGVNSGYNVNGGGFGARSGPGNPMFGRTHSDKAKASMSAKRKGKLNPNFGKNASPNTKRAMSLKKKGIYLGENNPKAKLTNEQAQMVRVLFANGDISINQLAKQFGVHRNVIERILRNETYKENK